MLNLRDVGGLRTADGRKVALGRLYRSDAPLPGDAHPDLDPWPPRTVIDLRSGGEALAAQHPLNAGGTRVVALPLFGGLDPGRLGVDRGGSAPELPAIYTTVVRRAAETLVAIAAVVAEGPWPVLIHCAAGKDRTGVAVAVILTAVGVRTEEVVADYIRTEESLGGLLGRLGEGWSPAHRDRMMHRLTVERPDLMRAPAGAIEAALDTLAAWPGQTPGWLRDHGLAPATLDALEAALLTP